MDDLPVATGRKRLLSEMDDSVVTPKKARAQHPITPRSTPRPTPKSQQPRLPTQLQHVLSAYTLIVDALIPALASGGVEAFTADKDDPTLLNLPNVLNHLNIPGLTLDNLKRVVYLLEWDASAPSPLNAKKKMQAEADDDNPFLVPGSAGTKPSMRGGDGIIVCPSTHLNLTTRTRSPVYGIGIQLVRKGKSNADMNQVTRWLQGRKERKQAVEQKLEQWAEHHRKASKDGARGGRSTSPSPMQIPSIPMADLKALIAANSGHVSSATSSPTKQRTSNLFQTPVKPKSFVPFPTPDSSSSSKTLLDSILITPSKSDNNDSRDRTLSTPRRDAIALRILKRSMDGTPTKNRVAVTMGTDIDGNAKTKIVSLEVMRRRCVLGRLDSIAVCVASLFSQNPNGGTLALRRRRIKKDEVVRVVVKSAKAPLSDAEASESLDMLIELCPGFLKSENIDREPYLIMQTIPASSPTKSSSSSVPPSTPRKPRMMAPPSSPSRSPAVGRRFPVSPGSGMTKHEIEEDLLSRTPGDGGSPRRVRLPPVGADGVEYMTLADVRERIRRELEKE